MTHTQKVQSARYTMPSEMSLAYSQVHAWLDDSPRHHGFRRCSWNKDKAAAVAKKSPKHAAFYFNSLFPTHFFKAYHALRSEEVHLASQLEQWLRFNPHLAVLDLGCGDGAGSCAIIAAVLDLRLRQLLDPRPLQIHIVAVDVDQFGLEIYQRVVSTLATEISETKIQVSFEILPLRLNDAVGDIESGMNRIKVSWGQPFLARLLSIESNLNDYLEREHRINQRIMADLRQGLESAATPPDTSAFGVQLALFYRQLLEMIPIDKIHIVTVDTKPNAIMPTIQTRLTTLEGRLAESGHCFYSPSLATSQVSFINPQDCYWRRREHHEISPEVSFVVSSCNLSHHDQVLDSLWSRITDVENLELAWARARRDLLGGPMSDEVEIRLFEYDLNGSLQRVHEQLDQYAIQAGYIPDTFRYETPKSDGKVRPQGLEWLENELMMVAIIQVAGESILEHRPYSFAYRLSQENNDDNQRRTEYLYERWSDAWKSFQQEAGDYARNYREGVVFGSDISKFFEHIVHDRVSELVRDELRVGSKRIQWLIQRLVEKDIVGHDHGRGLVQGSVGSGFLANLYLSPLDNYIRPNDAKHRRLFRYVDDIYVVIPDPEDREQTEARLNQILQEELLLEPNPDKTDTYGVDRFLTMIAPDAELDELQNRFEQTMSQVRTLNDELRTSFRNAWSDNRLWWNKVDQFRACFTELGLYITATQLSRAVQRTFSEKEGAATLDFPSLPVIGTFAESMDWAKDFRQRNPQWATDLKDLKRDLELLFADSLTQLESFSKKTDKYLRRTAERRLRFAANRLGLLGLDQVHDRLREILCIRPDLLRNPQRLMDDLARQAYASDVLKILEAHVASSCEAASYMRAMAVKALRLLPRLTEDLWRQLVRLMFEDDDITRLMATETWLILSSRHKVRPLETMVCEKTIACLQAPQGVSRRLLKNYILTLGVLDHDALPELPTEHLADPMLILAHSVASQGRTSHLFASVEPDVLRRRYYSGRYDDHDGDGGPY